MDERERVIIALDEPDFESAIGVVDSIGEAGVFFKVGVGLFAKEGGRILDALKERGKKIFLDVKLHDIPHAVAAAGRAIAGRGVDMFTVHASGGREMIAACRQAVDEAAAAGAKAPAILGVTVLTSISEETLREQLLNETPIPRLVPHLAGIAKEGGADGVVASPLEAALLRERHPEPFIIVTPGIRPSWAAAGDQRRTLSPGEAFRRGATYIVVGRPVTGAADPVAALEKIISEIDSAA
ncbi:MAG: orotidine-5'-phosphate decarboxylase [bacterium]